MTFIDDIFDASTEAAALVRRARRWPGFVSVERRVSFILKYHADFKRGPVDALRLFKAYRLALNLPSNTRL